MKFYTIAFILVATMAAVALAEPIPEPAKASRYRAAQIIEDDADANEDNVDTKLKETVDESAATDDTAKKGDASSGRLFMKKFLLFKNMFSQKQPIIPIIITGGTATASPTSTVTSTVTVPTGTGTVTTSPITSPTTTTPTRQAEQPVAAPVKRVQQVIARDGYEDNSEDNNNNEDGAQAGYEASMVDEETLAAALGAGAEEYVVTEQEIKGTSDAKASRAPGRVNLRRRGAKKGQVVSVRVPNKYRNYFKKGQRVILNNKNNRPGKRRIIKKQRVNKNRNRKNKNKRRRIVAA